MFLALVSTNDNQYQKILTTRLSGIWILHSKEKERKDKFNNFNEKMQWKYQIRNITQKVNLKLCKIKSIASFLTPHTEKLEVNALAENTTSLKKYYSKRYSSRSS